MRREKQGARREQTSKTIFPEVSSKKERLGKMEITKKKLSEITPYKNNAKKHDKRQIANVAESIKRYGFVQPLVIDRDGVIVIGHCRALAAQKLGMTENGT